MAFNSGYIFSNRDVYKFNYNLFTTKHRNLILNSQNVIEIVKIDLSKNITNNPVHKFGHCIMSDGSQTEELPSLPSKYYQA